MREIACVLLAVVMIFCFASCYIEGPDRSKYSSVGDSVSNESDIGQSSVSDTFSQTGDMSNVDSELIGDQSGGISNEATDRPQSAKELYTDYLTKGGYSRLIALGANYDSTLLSVSSCLVDLNNDGVSELLIHLARHDLPEAVTSALLGIKSNRVVVLAKAEQSGGSMGGDGLYLKKDTQSGENVIALVGNYSVGYAQQDSCFSVISNTELYENSVGNNVFSFDAQSLYLNSKYMPSEVASIKAETKVYVHDGNDFYAYSVNGRYMTRNAYKDTLRRFDDETGEVRLVKTSYAEPVV